MIKNIKNNNENNKINNNNTKISVKRWAGGDRKHRGEVGSAN